MSKNIEDHRTFRPTHQLVWVLGYRRVLAFPVQVESDAPKGLPARERHRDEPAYTEEEWHAYRNARLRLCEGRWSFDGRPVPILATPLRQAPIQFEVTPQVQEAMARRKARTVGQDRAIKERWHEQVRRSPALFARFGWQLPEHQGNPLVGIERWLRDRGYVYLHRGDRAVWMTSRRPQVAFAVTKADRSLVKVARLTDHAERDRDLVTHLNHATMLLANLGA